LRCRLDLIKTVKNMAGVYRLLFYALQPIKAGLSSHLLYDDPMRLFAGIEIPSSVQHQIHLWWQQAGKHFSPELWRPVSPDLWHITLAFYGDCSGSVSDDLAESLAECASQNSIIDLKTAGFGCFPKPEKANVFWLGVQDNSGDGNLKHLARCCRRAGHATVRKRTAREAAFQGHITLARSRERRLCVELESLQSIADVPELDWCADRIILYQSILAPHGPQYRRLERFELRSSSDRTRGRYV